MRLSKLVFPSFAFTALVASQDLGPALAGRSEPAVAAPTSRAGAPVDGPVREYWITAEEQRWEVAPNPDKMSGKSVPAENQSYRAVRYFAYSPNFAQRLPEDPLLGVAGPVIDLDVGDRLVIHFRNLDASGTPHSMHLHGVHYKPDSDGGYMASEPDAPGTALELGQTYTYRYWAEADSAGVWPYHDHSIEGTKSTARGLYGAVRVHATREPPFDREFFVFFAGLEPADSGLERDFDVINGLAYMGNTPQFMVNRGEWVRFNVIGLGSEFHTFHIHGYRWQTGQGENEDVKQIGPAQAWAIRFQANEPGMWMYHCHVEEHMLNGMAGEFMVM